MLKPPIDLDMIKGFAFSFSFSYCSTQTSIANFISHEPRFVYIWRIAASRSLQSKKMRASVASKLLTHRGLSHPNHLHDIDVEIWKGRGFPFFREL